MELARPNKDHRVINNIAWNRPLQQHIEFCTLVVYIVKTSLSD